MTLIIRSFWITLMALAMSVTGSYAQFGAFGSMGGKKAADIKPDFSEHKFAPAVGFQSLLSEVKIDPQKGILELGTLEMYFMPSKETNGKEITYRAYNNKPENAVLKAELMSKTSDQVEATFYLELTSLQRIVSNAIVYTDQKEDFITEYQIKNPGRYELLFYLADKPFYSYVFEVVKTPTNDPYSSVEALYTIGGDWEKYALLQVNENGQGGEYTLRFQPLMNYHGIHLNSNSNYFQTSADAEMKCTIKRGSKVIGAYTLKENDDPNDIFGEKYVSGFDDYGLRIDKILYEQSAIRFFQVPKVTSGQDLWLQMKQLTDGDYTIEISMRGMADRSDFTKTYKFEVAGGRVVPAAQANREIHEDPTTYLETGRDYVLIEAH